MAAMTPTRGERFTLPDNEVLVEGLSHVFGCDLEVLDRDSNVHASTFPSEFVICRLADGRSVNLFCKYGEDEIDTCNGHRRNALYEGEVYRRLLADYSSSTPVFVGTFPEPAWGRTWLILERIPLAHRITLSEDPESGMRAVARWIGLFHATQAGNALNSTHSYLIRHDRDYYAGWVHRTAEFGRPLLDRYPWLDCLPELVEPLVRPLIDAPRTVIHGELYPHNLLKRGEAIFALDWQSTAVAAGEIDLAALTERWPAAYVEEWEEEYRAARWPIAAPTAHRAVLDAARIHCLCRWLGDRPHWTLAERSVWRLQELGDSLRRLGLL